MIRFTRRITGASEARSFRCSTSRHEAQAREDHAQLLARLALLQAQRAVEVGRVELAPGDEDFPEAAGRRFGGQGGHGRKL
jgi:hypothetical protein